MAVAGAAHSPLRTVAMAMALFRICIVDAGKPEGQRLFDDSFSHTSDELRRIRTLSAGLEIGNKTAFLEASSLADFIGLHHVEAVHMPIPVAVVFVGFAGDGNMAMDLDTEQVQKWFGHLDHVLPHTRIELADLSCAEDGHCAGLVHGQYRATPVHSTVHLNFSSQTVVVRRRTVAAAFERAIHVFGRPVDVDVESGEQQVDATKMEAFVDSFVESLGLDKQYTIVVLNPTWAVGEVAYGYRTGLSARELDIISREKDTLLRLLQTTSEPEPVLPSPGGSLWSRAEQLRSALFTTSRDATSISDEWVKTANAYLSREEALRETMLQRVQGMRKGQGAIVQAARILRRLTGPLATIMRFEVMGDDAYKSTRLRSSFSTAHPATDCLVGNWVGSKRWMLLDLTATAGTQWGPALGGEGVVHEYTVPRVASYFGSLSDRKKGIRQRDRVQGTLDHDLQRQLADQKGNVLAQTSKDEYATFTAKRKAWDAERSQTGKNNVREELEKWGKSYRQALAKAELDAYEQFALRHCHLQEDPPPLCDDIKEDAQRLRAQILKMAATLGTGMDDELPDEGIDTGTLFPDHLWDIFGLPKAAGTEGRDDRDGLSESEARARDFFMADLAAVLSRGLRHVIVPPTAVWRHDGPLKHDTATPFASRVTFEITVINEVSRMVGHSETALFDLRAFEEQVKRLALVSDLGKAAQSFEFKVHKRQMDTEPELAAAFAVSVRSSYYAITDTSAPFGAGAEVLYVDSRELSHHVRAVLERKSAWPTEGRGDGHLVVPVLLFQLNRDVAVLVDEHYNAKALEDMVLVVQNAARFAEHPTGMSCGGTLLARPLSPLKEALGAVLTYLGGVLPPHIGYSPARMVVTHDWLWSVGAHPLSATSTGVEYTQMQLDALGRSYLLDALDSTIEVVNRGVRLMQTTRPTPELYAHVVRSKVQLRDMLSKYDKTVDLWRNIVVQSYKMDWGSAIAHVQKLREHSEAFGALASHLSTEHGDSRCAAPRPRLDAALARYWHVVLAGSAIAALAACIYALLPLLSHIPRRRPHVRGLALRH